MPARELERALRRAIEHDGEISLQAAAAVDGKLIVDTWAGCEPDDVFPVFSVSKGVLAAAANVFVERGLLSPSMRIVELWPEFGEHGKQSATVADALTHRTAVPQMPAGCTPEQLCDWDWMAREIAALPPLWEPGAATGYHAYTFGWIVGELLRRADPARRDVGTIIRDEVVSAAGATRLWMGIPAAVERHVGAVAKRELEQRGAPPRTPLMALAIPDHLATGQALFGRSDIRRACIPAAGGIADARSLALIYSSLVSGRLSGAGVERFSTPLIEAEDLVLGRRVRRSLGMFVAGLPGSPDTAPMGDVDGAFGHVGAGGSIAWADPRRRAGFAIVKSRMLPTAGAIPNPAVPIGRLLAAAAV